MRTFAKRGRPAQHCWISARAPTRRGPVSAIGIAMRLRGLRRIRIETASSRLGPSPGNARGPVVNCASMAAKKKPAKKKSARKQPKLKKTIVSKTARTRKKAKKKLPAKKVAQKRSPAKGSGKKKPAAKAIAPTKEVGG